MNAIYNWVPKVSLKLNTKNFLLRSLNLSDVNQNHISWLNDKKVNKWLNSNWKLHDSYSVRNFIQSQDHYNTFHLAIIDKKSSTHIGNFTILIDHHHKTAETRVVIGEKKWWGKGVVLECRECIINWLFEEINVYKIYGQPSLKNIAAVFNYQKQGYTCEAVLKDHKISLETKRYDVGIFSLTKDAWGKKF